MGVDSKQVVAAGVRACLVAGLVVGCVPERAPAPVVDAGSVPARPTETKLLDGAGRPLLVMHHGQRLQLSGAPPEATLAVILQRAKEGYSTFGPVPIRDDGRFHEFLAPAGELDMVVVFLKHPPPSPPPPIVADANALAAVPGEVARRTIRVTEGQ